MDGERRKKIRNHLILYLVFLMLFSCSVYALLRYEDTINRRQMVRFLANHPELEAEIISLWEKKGKRLPFAEQESESMDNAVRRLEETYGYELKDTISDTALRIFWFAGDLAAVLLALLPVYLWRRRSREEAFNRRRLCDLSECLEQFRAGRFETFPDYEEEPEEWMKLRESLRELGSYFADLKMRLLEEENNTKALITDISHQLKTPFSSLRMSHELSVASELTKEERREF